MNQLGDIIEVYPRYANSEPIYCKIIKFTPKRIKVRRLRKRLIKTEDPNAGERIYEYQLDVNDYPEDQVKYVKREYYEPYVGGNIVITHYD